jgi:hypothetical protein
MVRFIANRGKVEPGQALPVELKKPPCAQIGAGTQNIANLLIMSTGFAVYSDDKAV